MKLGDSDLMENLQPFSQCLFFFSAEETEVRHVDFPQTQWVLGSPCQHIMDQASMAER